MKVPKALTHIVSNVAIYILYLFYHLGKTFPAQFTFVAPKRQKAYHISTPQTRTADEAKAYCVSIGGMLATIKTQEEWTYVQSIGIKVHFLE